MGRYQPMKHVYACTVCMIVAAFLLPALHAQKKDSARTIMLRVYEDNDCTSILGKFTDDAYTNGTRLEYFYQKDKKTGFLLIVFCPVRVPMLLTRAGGE